MIDFARSHRTGCRSTTWPSRTPLRPRVDTGADPILSLDLILGLSALALLGRFWYGTLQAREIALRAARHACQSLDVQLLDQTVALAHLGLARDGGGRWRVSRRYGFEFSHEGTERRAGSATLLGMRVDEVQLELPDGLVVMPARQGVTGGG